MRLNELLDQSHRLLDQVPTRLRISSDLMRHSDWKVSLSYIGMTPAQNLWENWFLGNRNGSVSTLAHILDLAVEIADADFGNIQLFDPIERGLRIATSRGLGGEFLEYFAVVRSSDSACAVAMQQNCRVIVSDVRTDPCFNAESREIMLRAKVLSVQSTPIILPCGRLLGMLSTHGRATGTPPLSSLPLLDRLARRTAKVLE